MTSRKYLKRVWRVPIDRGPADYLGAILVKTLRKHGWPAIWEPLRHTSGGVQILHHEQRYDAAQDFWSAVSVAVSIVGRAYVIDLREMEGTVLFGADYRVNERGQFVPYYQPINPMRSAVHVPSTSAFDSFLASCREGDERVE